MLDNIILSETNFILYAAKHYNNPQCYEIEEFNEDLKRFKYIKRLLNKYIEYGDLKERLILNHIIALNNVFGPSKIAKMLFVKLEGYEEYLLPFLELLGCLPSTIYGVGTKNRTIITEKIFSDKLIQEKLKEI